MEVRAAARSARSHRGDRRTGLASEVGLFPAYPKTGTRVQATTGAGTGQQTAAGSSRYFEPHSIVLADFANSTGNPVFDDRLKQALAIALRQSPFLKVLSDEKAVTILRLMTLPSPRR